MEFRVHVLLKSPHLLLSLRGLWMPPDPHKWTPLQRAAYNGYANVVEVLAPYCTEPNARDPSGLTPIQTAAYYGHSNVVRVLAPLVKNPNAPNYIGWTPIQYAAKMGHYDVIESLLELMHLTANINDPDPEGQKPSNRISKSGNLKLGNLLCSIPTNDQDSDPDTKNDETIYTETVYRIDPTTGQIGHFGDYFYC